MRNQKSKDSSLSFSSIIHNKELRNRILFTIALLLVYRLLAAITLPGIPSKAFAEVFGNSNLSQIWSYVTGGRLDSPSVVGIGLGAYISASIVVQLLTTIVPKLEELSKEGERGKRIINQITRLLAIPLNIVQALAIYSALRFYGQTNLAVNEIMSQITTLDVITMVASLTAGGMILMWLSEFITEKGITNGSSLIIAVGILAGLPIAFSNDFYGIWLDIQVFFSTLNWNILASQSFIVFYAFIIGFSIMIWGVVYITEAVRKIPIQYANRVRSTQSGANSFLPLKINQAGVMPVIFASTLLTIPVWASSLLMNTSNTQGWAYQLGSWLNTSFLNQTTTSTFTDIIYYNFAYFVVIILFSYFYTFVAFKPDETAENLKKSGGFIPGIRPGKETQSMLTSVILRLAFVGSLFLATIALVPVFVRLIPEAQNLSLLNGIGGTGVLIVVGVILDTMRQMKSVSVAKSYDQFK